MKNIPRSSYLLINSSMKLRLKFNIKNVSRIFPMSCKMCVGPMCVIKQSLFCELNRGNRKRMGCVKNTDGMIQRQLRDDLMIGDLSEWSSINSEGPN